jgi:hypothetical protein
MILHKINNIYSLMDNDKMIASSDLDFQIDYEIKALSKENCDHIFGVVDVDKLAFNYADEIGILHTTLAYSKHFKAGFNKAIELNKDKLFTVDDLTHVIDIAVQWALRTNGTGETYQEMSKRIYQSLQQPTEIEVEIVMDDIFDGIDSARIFSKEETSMPMLDKNNCLILKRI